MIAGSVRPRSTGNVTLDLFEQHQGTHILQVRLLMQLCCLVHST